MRETTVADQGFRTSLVRDAVDATWPIHQTAPRRNDGVVAAGLDIEIVQDRDRLEALAPEWTALQRRHGQSHQVFQSFAWIAAWTRHFATSGATRPAVAFVRRDGDLIMIWPLALHRTFGVRRLVWAGAPVSQYGDVIAAPSPDMAQILTRSWQFIVKVLKPDAVHLRRVRADATVAGFLAEVGATQSEPERAPFMDFGEIGTYAIYEQRYAGKVRKNRRRLLRRLEEQGIVEFGHLRPGQKRGTLPCVRST